jgi:lipoprotein-releasing system ATP-binding protein
MHNKVSNVILFKNISHSFMQGTINIKVLNNVNFELPKKCIAGLIGASGSGKSTFLQLAGLLESPQEGKIFINDVNTTRYNNSQRTVTRRNSIGFVYQKIYLLPEFSALENVVIPQRIIGVSKTTSFDRAKDILSSMGLKNRMNHRPSNLSGGEQQRVAIARALINSPDLILADEPTGNLDSKSSELVTQLLIDNIRNTGASALIATHSTDLAKKLDILFEIKNGKINLI